MSTIRQRPAAAGQVEKDQLLREAEDKEVSEGQRFIVPNFTVKQLLDAIPAHCFHRSALHSSLYVLQDVVAIAVLAYAAFQIDPLLSKLNISPLAYTVARVVLYSAYVFAASLFGTGLWIIGHECGHQAYSSSKAINNTVGWFLHCGLLVPYHAWRISHGRHHAATGHLTRDEVFVPRTRSQLGVPAIKEEAEFNGISVSAFRQQELKEALEESPIYLFTKMFVAQLLGWPLYLFRNASGQLHYPAGTNHFNPEAIIFKPNHYWQIVVSNIGVSLTLAILAYWTYQRTFSEVLVFYILPYLGVNHWLVFITYLQHTDPVLPHYSANKWTFARGALATIDRNFLGFVGPYITHGICETHVSHHISSKIPHYNAWEATDALKAFLGVHYQKSEENMFVSFYKSHRDCLFVEDNQDVVFFKNARGVASKIAVEEGGNVSDSGVDMSK